MRFSSLLSPTAGARSALYQLPLLLIAFAQSSRAITLNAIPPANLDFSQLGRVGLAGDFDGISLYEYQGQNENGFNNNGSQSVMARYPDGGFANLVTADASIKALCPFVMHDGTMAGIIAAGNFTSLGGMETIAVALINPNTSAVTQLTGLSGQVTALYCDQTTNAVYVGGSFKGANSTNAIAWVGTAGWTNLPFNGFNGPVNSITKAANGNIIFGGTFTGLGNASAPAILDEQVINIPSGNITSGSTSTTAGFGDPKNIICKTGGTDGPGNTWLLADNKPGYWRADFAFGFEPTKLRLWNTHQDGRGTKTWRYTNDKGGIMNFTYTDPATGVTDSCTSECPLSNNASVAYQDFHFVNVIGMGGFQIDISAWYGNGGGLNGIELFENDIFAYAIDSFNEPTCASIATASKATTTGQWTVLPSSETVNSEYLSIGLSGATIDPTAASVVFYPDVKQSGNYSVNMYTPGCVQDNSCTSRGRVNITGAISSSLGSFHTEIFQSNMFSKYDQIYFGYIEAASSSFRPSITLSPSSGQTTSLTVVAHRIGLTLISPSSGGLNSLFEYDPTQAVVNTADFANSTFDKAGSTIGNGGGVQALATLGGTTYVAGNFSTTAYDNIFAVTSSGPSALAGGGLNSHVMTMFANGTLLYVGGNFTSTSKSAGTGLNNIAAYDTSKNAWAALGAGVNGRVFNIVPLSLNISGSNPETVVTITGNFNQILAFGSNPSIAVSGFAVWVPSHNNWLQNIDATTISLKGQLSASVDVPTGGQLFAGSLSSETLSANGIVSLTSGLKTLPINILQSQSQSSNSLGKRAASSNNVTGVVTGIYYTSGGRNITVIGGHFAAIDSSGATINNLAFINGSNSDTVTGVGSQLSNGSTILALAVQNDTLYAGGVLTGTVNGNSVDGLISYNFLTSSLNTQLPPLAGSSVAVFAIGARPNSGDVYVAGDFRNAGSLDCPGVCYVMNPAGQWHRPGTNLDGTGQAMLWTGENTLVVGGSLTIGGAASYLVSYDVPSQVWSSFNGASAIPGPINAITPATSDDSQLWVAGTATNGSSFLMKYDGSNWNSVGYLLGAGTNIRGLQVLSLTQNHDSTNLMPSSQSLLLTGSLNVPGFGNASAVVYNGTTFQPYALTSSGAGGPRSVSQIFFQNQNTFATEGGHLALGFIVLIGLAISLALIFSIVVAGIVAERIRRKREGYMPAPTNMFDKASQMSRLPPEQLFGTVGHGRSAAAPTV